VSAHAQLTWSTNADGTITITDYSGSEIVITIPGTINGHTVTEIGPEAFSDDRDPNLVSVFIPDGVTTIGNGAFRASYGLRTVNIPNSVTNISYSAFAGTGLTSVSLGKDVLTLGFPAGRLAENEEWAFSGCSSLTNFSVDPLNPNFRSDDGVLFSKSGETLLAYPTAKPGSSYIIPNSVRKIGLIKWAEPFQGSGLTNITIPDSVTNIIWRAFWDMPELRSIFFAGMTAPSLGLDSVGSSIFDSPNLVTVYYLPGASGFAPSFNNVPVVLWNPVIQTTNADFGIGPHGFGFNIAGTPNIPVVVDASSDLTPGSWTPLQTLSLTNGLVFFNDSQWNQNPMRFYRIRSP
jgi:hypothetical protein